MGRRRIAPASARGPMTSSDRGSPLLRLVILGAGLAIIAAAMQAAAPVVNLVLVSLLLAATLSPLPLMLANRGMGRGTAIAITVVLALVGGAILILVLTGSLGRLSENLPKYQSSLAGLVDGVNQKLAARGIAVDRGPQAKPGEDHGQGGRAGGRRRSAWWVRPLRARAGRTLPDRAAPVSGCRRPGPVPSGAGSTKRCGWCDASWGSTG